MDTNYKYLILLLLFIYGFGGNSYSQQKLTSLDVLSKGADVVLTGKVLKQKSSWNEDKSRIYTEATLKVEEYLKGNLNESSVIVKYPGGEVGAVGELYTHMPRFENDEEVLVFLKKEEKSSNYRVFDGEDGKLSIVLDKNTGEKVTSSNLPLRKLKLQIKRFISEK